jgi:hypothetical protein
LIKALVLKAIEPKRIFFFGIDNYAKKKKKKKKIIKFLSWAFGAFSLIHKAYTIPKNK